MIRAAASIRARCENACGKLPEVAARAGVELLGVEAERRGDAEQALHQIAGALLLADDRQRRDEPERADQEASLLARQAVVGLAGAVAQDEAVLGQVVGDREHALSQALVVSPGRNPKIAASSVEASSASVVVVLAQHAVLEAVLEDVLLDLVRGRAPGWRSSSGSPRMSASLAARSSATQHMSFEDT